MVVEPAASMKRPVRPSAEYRVTEPSSGCATSLVWAGVIAQPFPAAAVGLVAAVPRSRLLNARPIGTER